MQTTPVYSSQPTAVVAVVVVVVVVVVRHISLQSLQAMGLCATHKGPTE